MMRPGGGASQAHRESRFRSNGVADGARRERREWRVPILRGPARCPVPIRRAILVARQDGKHALTVAPLLVVACASRCARAALFLRDRRPVRRVKRGCHRGAHPSELGERTSKALRIRLKSQLTPGKPSCDAKPGLKAPRRSNLGGRVSPHFSPSHANTSPIPPSPPAPPSSWPPRASDPSTCPPPPPSGSWRPRRRPAFRLPRRMGLRVPGARDRARTSTLDRGQLRRGHARRRSRRRSRRRIARAGSDVPCFVGLTSTNLGAGGRCSSSSGFPRSGNGPCTRAQRAWSRTGGGARGARGGAPRVSSNSAGREGVPDPCIPATRCTRRFNPIRRRHATTLQSLLLPFGTSRELHGVSRGRGSTHRTVEGLGDRTRVRLGVRICRSSRSFRGDKSHLEVIIFRPPRRRIPVAGTRPSEAARGAVLARRGTPNSHGDLVGDARAERIRYCFSASLIGAKTWRLGALRGTK